MVGKMIAKEDMEQWDAFLYLLRRHGIKSFEHNEGLTSIMFADNSSLVQPMRDNTAKVEEKTPEQLQKEHEDLLFHSSRLGPM